MDENSNKIDNSKLDKTIVGLTVGVGLIGILISTIILFTYPNIIVKLLALLALLGSLTLLIYGILLIFNIKIF